MQLKDQVLDTIAQRGANIAQFVSYGPDGNQRFFRVRGVELSRVFATIEEAVDAILKTGAPYVNIRSFLQGKPDGNPFIMGRKGYDTPVKIAAKCRELMGQGYYIVLNEEIDILDGGFSGVLFGDIAEFASRDVPRCVEKEGCAVLPRLVMVELVRTVYGHLISIPFPRDYRVEFSVSPGPVGYLRQGQIVWQAERMVKKVLPIEPRPDWPNRYSEDMGDKAYGLLMAHLHGFRVPQTKVFGRVIPHFSFGEETKSLDVPWVRTCPREQQPGLFTTKHGWLDPYALMQKEDPDGTKIASIIVQDDVEATYSGAAITQSDGSILVEGKAGHGDTFMVGESAPEEVLPEHVTDGITNVWEKMTAQFGPVRFEWVFDEKNIPWVVQFHRGKSSASGNVIYPGEPTRFEAFDVKMGLEKLRALIEEAKQESFGIILKGNVGITSHFGDVLRRNEIPSRLERSLAQAEESSR